MKHLHNIQQKIMGMPALSAQLRLWRNKGERIVFTNGCFDLVHRGHVEYLSAAADLGDRLIVGINSDASVARLKGPNRPIMDETSRQLLMAALECVDAVILFEEDTPYRLIQEIQPDVLVKGGDYTEETMVGADIVRTKGGEIHCIPLIPGCSTSRIEQKIKKQL
ncbi:MAG: D-glycero-beta-D-manno-heptose 1-phosphate adenylyltransferase [Bacteroidales bacterium]|nr:D-glycero-beta-D-manno-heptose 1-phosphate adenylyltransferase [Bacteroidales bacterium]